MKVLWNKILAFAKGYGTIMVVVTVIATVSIKYDRHVVSLDTVINNQDYQNDMLDKIEMRVNRIENTQLHMSEDISKLGDNVETVGNAVKVTQQTVLNYISKDNTITKEDLLEYMKTFEFELKKNSPSLSQGGTP